MSLIRRSFLGHGSVEVHRVKSEMGPPREALFMSSSETHATAVPGREERWLSYFNSFDTGGMGCLHIPPVLGERSHLPLSLEAKLLAVGPPLVYYSYGSHSGNVGGDALTVARDRCGFRAFLSAQPAGTQLVLALESAHGLGVPSRFALGGHSVCKASNLRIEARGLAAVQALRAECRDAERCRVLDLFSPTLPYIYDDLVYRRGDPIHFALRRERLEIALRAAICLALRTC